MDLRLEHPFRAELVLRWHVQGSAVPAREFVFTA